MIPKIMLFLVFTLCCLQGTFGISYSKVFYHNAGFPTPQLSRLNSPIEPLQPSPELITLDSVVAQASSPQAVIAPCLSPCTEESLGKSLKIEVPSKLVAHQSQHSSYPISSPGESGGYEYSYVVYDENTGDQKSQRELSDGNNVKGHYSFIQPDGYVRQVQYTANDLQGFNAVVKNFIPEDKYKSEINPAETKIEIKSPPCSDNKSGQLIEELKQKIVVESKEEPKNIILLKTNPEKEVDNQKLVLEIADPKPVIKQEEPVKIKVGAENLLELLSGSEISAHIETESPQRVETETPLIYEVELEPQAETEYVVEIKPEYATTTEHETETPEPLYVVIENLKELTTESPTTIEPFIQTTQRTGLIEFKIPNKKEKAAKNNNIPYNEVIKCLQSSINNNAPINVSPLTYILLPTWLNTANRSPCPYV